MNAVLTHEQSRATTAIGFGAIACCLFRFAKGAHFQLIAVDNKTLVLLLVVGALTVLSGFTRNAVLTAVAGSAFLLAAVIALVQLAADTSWLGGGSSTFALYLGFGVALAALVVAAVTGPSTLGQGATLSSTRAAGTPTKPARGRTKGQQ